VGRVFYKNMPQERNINKTSKPFMLHIQLTESHGNRKLTSQSEQVKEAEIKIVAVFAEHNLAFQISDHLKTVLKNSFIDSTIAKELTLNRKNVRIF